MPLYLRGGVGPLRFSHRLTGRREDGPPAGLVVAAVACALVWALLIWASVATGSWVLFIAGTLGIAFAWLNNAVRLSKAGKLGSPHDAASTSRR